MAQFYRHIFCRAFIAILQNHRIPQEILMNREGPDQTEQIYKMIWAFAVCIRHKDSFLTLGYI